jgi:signal peptidase II
LSGAARPIGRPAGALAAAYVGLVGLAVAVVVLDQASKAVVASTLRTRSIALLGGGVHLTYVRNTGAAFSLLPGGGLVFASIAIAVSAGIVLYYRRVAAGPALLRIGLSLVLGGAIGNLIDRVRLGYVVDFIDLRWWPVFNVADSAIVVGVAALVLRSLVDTAHEGS